MTQPTNSNECETRADIEKLLYKQVPLLIEKLKHTDGKECFLIVQAIREIVKMPLHF